MTFLSCVGTALCIYTAITHTPPWTPKIMGFHRVWVSKEVIIGCLVGWWTLKSMGYCYGLSQVWVMAESTVKGAPGIESRTRGRGRG